MERITRWDFSGKALMALAVSLLVAVALGLSGLCADDAYAASSKKKAQHKKYEKTIKSYHAKMKKQAKAIDKQNKSYGLKTSYASNKTYFAFADIDKNGVDELIVRYEDKSAKHNTAVGDGYGETTTIYTIKSGKVKKVLDNTEFAPYFHDAYTHIYKGSKYTDQGFSHGYEDLSFWKYSKGKLSKKCAYWLTSIDASHTSTGKASYRINDKEVSAKKYAAKKKALMGTGKGYTMHAYSSKTFKKYI
ncbi:hypothetical protein [uncultured Adlercreutzia sp.]|uniref:hypothetical protein n=1 Tax=uncultured Adlercreutzia sp. TaxID=875803 RepID=UPI0025EA7FB4|nr:hypothetical protein [uncultured Adlercreutzia sp.]